MHDLKNALRSLRSAPLTSAAAVLVIALGAGANVAVFAITYGVLVKPLPYFEPSRLVTLRIANNDGSDFGIQLDEIDDWQEHWRTAEAVAGFLTSEVPIRDGQTTRLVGAAHVTQDFFEVLGVSPPVGQLAAFRESRDVAVISGGLARELATEDLAGIVGHGLTVGGESVDVTAALAEDFAFPAEDIDLWLRAEPAATAGGADHGHDPRAFTLVARLAPGVSLEQAREDARRALITIRGPFFAEPGAARPALTPIEDALFEDLRPVLAASVAAAFLVLLVTCGNVAMLLLERALVRRRDAAVKLALGAGWRQLVRGSLVESLVLASLGSLLGLGLAAAGVKLFARAAAGVIPRAQNLALDGPTLLASLATVFLVTLLWGTAPALRTARRDFTAAFREGNAGEPHTRRLLAALVVAQIAASIVLLAGAMLLTRTVERLMSEDTGASATSTLVAKLSYGDGTGLDPVAGAAFARRILERVRSLPGVDQAGIGSALPPDALPFQIYVSWRTETRNEALKMSVVSATPGFLEALGTHLVSGRSLTASDDRIDPPAALLSETAARFYSPDRDISGTVLPSKLPPVAPFESPPRILGVVRDVKYAGLDEPAVSAVYLPWSARPTETSFLAVRPRGSATALVPSLQKILREVDPGLPLPHFRTLEQETARSIADRRLRILPAIGFAGVALAVALTGLFALLARSAAERQREFAVRMALGAAPSQVRGLMLRRAALLTATGLTVGLAGTAAVAGGLRGLLYGVEPHDPATLVGVAALVAMASLVAAWLPAWRAARVAPWELLRTD